MGEAKVWKREEELAGTKMHWQSSVEALTQILPTLHLDPSRAFMITGFANLFFFFFFFFKSKQSIKGEKKSEITAWAQVCCYSGASHIVLREGKAGSVLFWGPVHTQLLASATSVLLGRLGGLDVAGELLKLLVMNKHCSGGAGWEAAVSVHFAAESFRTQAGR